MAHLQYIPGDPRLVDQLVYELKSKGIFDQFRKDCIADVDTRPAYQNLRQRVENSVSTFLSRQCWKPDLNKNQLREKLRKHILDGNYLEQGVERIVDQVVNPKVASVFIPQVEDLVYNYLGITRKKTTPVAETSNGKVTENDLLPTDLEAVSPGSVKSNDDKAEAMEISQDGEDIKMEIGTEKPKDEKDPNDIDKDKTDDTRLSGISELTSNDSMTSLDKNSIPLPSEGIKLENIPEPESSPPTSNSVKVELDNIELPKEPNLSTDIPLPEESSKPEKETFFKPVNSDDDDSSSDSSLRRNMSPLTPIRNFNNENSCDAQQAFEDEDSKLDKKEALEPSSFRFTIEAKATENSSDTKDVKIEKKETDQANLSYQFNNQININTFNTPCYDDSSNSTHLQIDYESDANSKINVDNKVPEPDLNSGDSRRDKKAEEKRSSHKSSQHRDSHRHSSSKDRRSDSKQTSSKDSKSDRKSSKDDQKSSSKSSHKEKSTERDKKDDRKDRDSSKHRSSHKSSSSSSHRDSKSHRSSSQRHSSSSSKHTDEKRSSSSSHRDKSDRSSDKYSKEKSSKESKSSSSSHRSDKDRKSSSSSKSKSDDKDRQKKDKKDTDDHYSASGRGNHTRRSTDRDSNDGSSSSKGSHLPTSSKSSENKKETKGSTSKSDNTSTSGESVSPSDKDHVNTDKSKNDSKSKNKDVPQVKPVVRIENHLETPISSPPRLPFVPDVTLKKPKFAANMEEARKLMKMRKFLDEEQKRMNQEAALLLEFQANVRPSLSQVYSSIPGPELEFACVTSNQRDMIISDSQMRSETLSGNVDNLEARNDTISDILTAAQQVENIEVKSLDRHEIDLDNSIVEAETTIVENEIDEETDQSSDKAKVQIENVLEADITSCEMDVDTTIEDKIQIIDNVSADLIEYAEQVCEEHENIVQPDIINDPEVKVISNIENHDDEIPDSDGIEAQLQSLMPDDDNDHERPEYFQVTIITEVLSETDEIEEKPDTIVEEVNTPKLLVQIEEEICPDEPAFEYFAEHEKYNAELERDTFEKFLKSFTERSVCDKIHLINCDSYEESIMKEVSANFGTFEVVNYYKNGHFKFNTAKNVVKNVNVSSEISLPVDKVHPSPMFSPVKSECSFDLSSDYDAKLEEMVSKTSRKEIMEIILGNVTDEATSECGEMPTIDYCMESNIESDSENAMKRKFCEVESSVNNNRQVLTPNKIRKLSGSDQISSTTEESEETSNNNVSNPMRSKYLGRAKRVGLPRPRRSNLPNSPSSDKSVENYEQNNTQTHTHTCLKTRKVQRYDTADLYKPKLHYLSRRNNIS